MSDMAQEIGELFIKNSDAESTLVKIWQATIPMIRVRLAYLEENPDPILDDDIKGLNKILHDMLWKK